MNTLQLKNGGFVSVDHAWPLDDESSFDQRAREAGYQVEFALGTDTGFNPVVYSFTNEARDKLLPEDCPPRFVVHLSAMAGGEDCIVCADMPELLNVLGRLAPIGHAAIASEAEAYQRDHQENHLRVPVSWCIHCQQRRQ